MVLTPILTLYCSYIHDAFSLFDFLLVLLFPFFIFSSIRSNNRGIFFIILPYFIYILLIVLFFVLFEIPESGSTLRAFRYLFYLLYVILFSKKFFDFNYAYRLLVYISVFATFFLILQIVAMNFFGFYISGYIPTLDLMREGLDEFGNSGFVERPRSFFVEPASYANYVASTLICILFSKKKIISYIPILLSIGLIFSASISGIVYLIFIFFVYYIRYYKSVKIRWQYLFLLLLIPALYLLLENRIDLIQERIGEGRSYSGRMSGYNIIDYIMISDYNFLFGYGFINTPSNLFLSGWVRLLFYIGISGVLMFAIMSLFLYKKSNQLGKVMILFLGLSGISGSGILSAAIILHLSIILLNKDINENSSSYK